MGGQVHYKPVLLGASTGGVDALAKLCQGLPHDLPATVLVCSTWRPRRAACGLPSRNAPGSRRPAQRGAELRRDMSSWRRRMFILS
ncbi:chemotaxis protein CheB [Siccirubricoccus soli]|uniref:chemotaxis protein CheB n=1 Tax=Siccirubricoccus soli TaxID=2899147 RepID=UPI003518AD8D